jgi:hypothetical protein
MTDKEKLNYMRIASAIIGYDLKEKDLDTVLSIHDLILRKEGEADLEDVVKIEHDIEKKYSQPNPIILEQHLKFEVYPKALGGHNWENAKKVCEDLDDGWRLPTREELHLMWLNRESIGGFAAAYYWSSSEDSLDFAWNQNFFNGAQNYYGKLSTGYVRAVRDVKSTDESIT